jgi:hypothetical protein
VNPFTLIGINSEVVILDKPGGKVVHEGVVRQINLESPDRVYYAVVYQVAVGESIFMWDADHVKPKPGVLAAILTVTGEYVIEP